jgi:hypothetical protein
MRTVRSPAAFTVEDGPRHSPAAFAETRPANSDGPAPPVARTQALGPTAMPQPLADAMTPAPKTVTGHRAHSGRRWVLGVATAAVLLPAGAAAVVVGLRHRAPAAVSPASAEPASAGSSFSVTSAVLAEPPTSATVPLPEPHTLSPSATAAGPRPANTPPLPASHAPITTPPTATPRGKAPAQHPKDSVESSGF